MKTSARIKRITLLLTMVFSICVVSFAQNSKADKKANQEAQINQIIDSQYYAYKNGSANLTVNSNNKQTISFSGYIVPIKTKKK